MTQPERITDLLLALRAGDADAAERLYAAVYPQLRRITPVEAPAVVRA